MAKAKKKEDSVRFEVPSLKMASVAFCIKGITPLIVEAVSMKAKCQLTLPSKKKTTSQKATTLKHDPVAEFRNGLYYLESGGPTVLAANVMWFKKAMTDAALDIEGATKAALGRLCFIKEQYIPLYGTPKLHASAVRLADPGRTVDMRFRPILPQWACMFRVQFVTPQLNERSVTSLMAHAGIIRGVGGWRQQKGSVNFGQFELCSQDDPEFLSILEKQGGKAQTEALELAMPCL